MQNDKQKWPKLNTVRKALCVKENGKAVEGRSLEVVDRNNRQFCSDKLEGGEPQEE
jgi:hypothetical protein